MIIRIRKADKAIFKAVKSGAKSVETRAATPRYKNVSTGTIVTFVCDGEKLDKTIVKALQFDSIAALTTYYIPSQILPGASAVDLAKMYGSFPGYLAKIEHHGLVAWELR